MQRRVLSPMSFTVRKNSGLARGFTHYEDYILEKLAPLRTSGLVEHTTTIFQSDQCF